MKTTYVYDEKSQLRELLHTDKKGILDHYTYEYDLLGNKTGITKERRNLEEESGAYTYGYDALERLSSIHKDGIRQTRYTYDAFGNRTGKEEQGTQIRYRYNSLNQLVSQTDQNADGSVSREIYRYDRRGNLSQIKGWTGKEPVCLWSHQPSGAGSEWKRCKSQLSLQRTGTPGRKAGN